jgi:5-formyltetrahydrofolate cyclo-ligase
MWDLRAGEKKPALRAAALSQRKSLSQEQALTLSQLIQARALNFRLYRDARSAALYSPIQNEVSTDEIREHGFRHGKQVFYPRLGAADAVDLVEVTSPNDLKPGRIGILEPVCAKKLADHELSGLILFVPGLAFDTQGNRLGRGMGWYDRLLARVNGAATSVALAYDFQVLSEIPSDPWDQKVQYVITESRIIDCRESRSQSGPFY